MRTSSAKPNFLPFLSTPSARRATSVLLFGVQQVLISIHALREEGDHPYSSWERGSNEFLSTPSARRATIPRPHLLCWHHDFYPRPPRGGRRRAAGVVPPVGLISIHALREEGDVLRRVWRVRLADFYPRPPRGGRPSTITAMRTAVKFLSTPSARRATSAANTPAATSAFLSTPSARRATSDSPASWQSCCISIHALREEGDLLEVSQWAM